MTESLSQKLSPFSKVEQKSPFNTPIQKASSNEVFRSTENVNLRDRLQKHSYTVISTSEYCFALDPLGNYVVVIDGDSVLKTFPAKSLVSKLTPANKEQLVKIASLICRGIFISDEEFATLIINDIDNYRETTVEPLKGNNIPSYQVTVPVMFISDIDKDIKAVIDLVDIVSADIASHIQKKCITSTKQLDKNLEDLRALSSTGEQLYHTIETINSFSSIYHNVSASSLIEGKINKEVTDKLRGINNIIFEVSSYDQELGQVNDFLAKAVVRLKAIEQRSIKIRDDLTVSELANESHHRGTVPQ